MISVPTGPDTAIPETDHAEGIRVVCARCRRPAPLDDDGFCDACRKAMEDACL